MDVVEKLDALAKAGDAYFDLVVRGLDEPSSAETVAAAQRSAKRALDAATKAVQEAHLAPLPLLKTQPEVEELREVVNRRTSVRKRTAEAASAASRLLVKAAEDRAQAVAARREASREKETAKETAIRRAAVTEDERRRGLATAGAEASVRDASVAAMDAAVEKGRAAVAEKKAAATA